MRYLLLLITLAIFSGCSLREPASDVVSSIDKEALIGEWGHQQYGAPNFPLLRRMIVFANNGTYVDQAFYDFRLDGNKNYILFVESYRGHYRLKGDQVIFSPPSVWNCPRGESMKERTAKIRFLDSERIDLKLYSDESLFYKNETVPRENLESLDAKEMFVPTGSFPSTSGEAHACLSVVDGKIKIQTQKSD